jgi:hypothetical protein
MNTQSSKHLYNRNTQYIITSRVTISTFLNDFHQSKLSVTYFPMPKAGSHENKPQNHTEMEALPFSTLFPSTTK